MLSLKNKIVVLGAFAWAAILLTTGWGMPVVGWAGALVIGLRSGMVGGAVGVAVLAMLLATRWRRFIKVITFLAFAAPLGWIMGHHLVQCATFRRIMDPGWGTTPVFFLATSLMTALMTGLVTVLMRFGVRLFQRPLHWVQMVAATMGSVLLVVVGRRLVVLHAPLTVGCGLAALWLLAGVIHTVAQRVMGGRAIWLIGVAVPLNLLAAFWTLDMETDYLAQQEGGAVGLAAHMGRRLTLTDIAIVARQQETANPPVKTPVTPAVPLPLLAGKSAVVISIDALRPDHLGVYGYKRPTSPNLDRWAKQALVVERAYATSPTSGFSVPAIFAGRPMEAAIRAHTPLPLFAADLLSMAGYETMGLCPPKVFSMGPELMKKLEAHRFGFEKWRVLAMDAHKDVQAVREMVAGRDKTKPLFLWAHFYDPHLPYSCHGKPFGADQMGCYDAEIAYLDEVLGPLLTWLTKELEDPVVMLTADHGEAFGEHGRYYHSTDLYDEQVRVPLMFRIPGFSGGRRPGPIGNQIIGALLPVLLGATPVPEENDPRRLLVKADAHQQVVMRIGDQLALIDRGHKLKCAHWPGGVCALYDLMADPDEQDNLVGQRLDVAASLLSGLKRFIWSETTALAEDVPHAVVLGRLGQGQAIGELAGLAAKKGPYQVESAKLLALLKKPAAGSALVTLTQVDNPEVVGWAKVGLALLNQPITVDELLGLASHKGLLGAWAAICVGKMGDKRSFWVLRRLLQHSSPELRAQAALALGKSGDKRAVVPLLTLLDVKQSRWAAIDALGAIGDRRAVAKLTRLKKSEPDRSNLPRYERALASIVP